MPDDAEANRGSEQWGAQSNADIAGGQMTSLEKLDLDSLESPVKLKSMQGFLRTQLTQTP